MRRKGKRNMILWIIIAIIVIISAIALLVFYPMLSMKPAETGEVPGTEVVAVRNGGNAVYLLEMETGYILVDAGSNSDTLKKALTDLGVDPANVSHIFLTHVDSDHVNGLNLFPNAQVYISEDEMKMLDGSTQRSSNRYCSLPDGFDKERLITLSDEQKLSIGDYSLTCLKSPGHTVGSMSFLVDEAFLFTGDAFRVQKGNILVSPFSMDKGKSKESIDHLYEFMDECQYVLTAHYGYHNAGALQLE